MYYVFKGNVGKLLNAVPLVPKTIPKRMGTE